MRLIDAEKISNYIKSEINPYGKPFEGNAYEFGLKLMKYLKNAGVDYDIDKVIKQLEEKDSDCEDFGTCNYCQRYWCPRTLIDRDDAIEIVKTGGNIDEQS